MAGQVYRSHADTIVDLLARQGDIAASGALRSGNIWSNEVANLGNQAGNAVQQIVQQKQEQARQQGLDAAITAYDPKDPQGSFGRLAKVAGPVEALKIQSGLDALHKKDEPSPASFDAKLDAVHALKSVYGDEGMAQRWGPIAQSIDPEAKAFLPGWDATQPYSKQTGDTIEALWQQRRGTKEKDQGFTLGPGQVRFDSSGRQIAAGPEKENKAPEVGSFGDYVLRKYGANPTSADIENARKVYHDAGVTIKVPGPENVKLSDDAVERVATAYNILGNNGIPTRFNENDKKQIINKATELQKLSGNTPAQLIQKQAAYKSDAAALTQMTKMGATSEAAESKAIAQADIIEELSKKVDRTSWQKLNKVLLGGKAEFNDSNTIQLQNAIQTFSMEYAKIAEGSTGSVAASSESARKASERMISAAMNKGTIKDVVALMKREMRNTILGYDVTKEHITERMGGGMPGMIGAPATASPAIGAPGSKYEISQ